MLKTEFIELYEELNSLNEAVEKIIAYHASSKKFNTFDISKVNNGTNDGGSYGPGIYFTDNPNIAKSFGGNVGYLYKVELNFEHPYICNNDKERNDLSQLIHSSYNNGLNSHDMKDFFNRGFDSVISNNESWATDRGNVLASQYVAFKNSQVNILEVTAYGEEFDTLTEAVSPEAQDFYKSINNKYKNLVDTESFIKAFKKDIPDNIWNKLFDDDMKFKNRGTYGIIKNEPLPAEAVAALKKYWAYQFASNIGFFKTTTMLAKEEAERKRKEDEKHAKVKADQEKAERVINLIDKQALDKLAQFVKEFDPDKLDNGPVIHTRMDGVTVNGSAVYVSFYTIKVGMATDATEKELADEFNKEVLAEIQGWEKIKAEDLAKQTRQEKYKNAKWYSEELEEWINNDYKATYLFQLPDDEGVQKVVKATWDKIERCHFTDDVELIAVIIEFFTEKSNPHSTTQSEYRNIYYSVNSEGDHAETLKAEDIVLDPTKFKPTEQYLVNDSYYEISAEDAKNDPCYFKTGMNQWFHNAIIYYGTD